jgi:hypothetical protein
VVRALLNQKNNGSPFGQEWRAVLTLTGAVTFQVIDLGLRPGKDEVLVQRRSSGKLLAGHAVSIRENNLVGAVPNGID